MSADSQIKILFLTAEPTNNARLRLQQELRDIREQLRLANQRERFLLEYRLSVRPRDISQALLNYEPHIVHFSGHGTSSGELCFEDELGKMQRLKPNALATLFKLMAEQVDCVILDACYSDSQAKAIVQHIPFVIGMKKDIGDKAAIAFALGFYDALGANRSIEEAFKFGCVSIQLEGVPEESTPVLLKKVDKPTTANIIKEQNVQSGDRIYQDTVKLILPDSLITAITGIAYPVIKGKILRSEIVIKLLQQFNLDPEHPPTDFSGVYAYALVEYGVGKPKPLLELFRQEAIKQAFRTALDHNNPSILLSEVDTFLDAYTLGDDIRNLGLDVRREVAEFATVFIEVAKRSRTPADVLMNQNIGSLHKRIVSIQEQLDRLPTLEGIRTEIARLAVDNYPVLPGTATENQYKAIALAQQMRGWFETLGYDFEKYEIWAEEYFEWIIHIPVRRSYDRILIRGVAGEIGLSDVMALRSSVEAQKTDEGWLVTTRRISRAAREEVKKEENRYLDCFTFDELIDLDADFNGYLDWLEAEIKRRKIDTKYVPLACTKEEIDPITKQRIGVSRYEEEDGWIDGYIDLWLDDPVKEHISILGEFGTGKTWFVFHYAWTALQRYRDAQKRGVERPRLPLVITLRDFAKAINVENLLAGFFFTQHNIRINSEVFDQLNRMGKLLLIFDGFDEMTAKVDRQQMINNFWELAKVVVPGAKVILTCRTEYFSEVKERRALLNAELQASTAKYRGERPQFEVLELEKFNDEQIRQVLSYQAEPATVEQIIANSQLLDLARRPSMTNLIVEVLRNSDRASELLASLQNNNDERVRQLVKELQLTSFPQPQSISLRISPEVAEVGREIEISIYLKQAGADNQNDYLLHVPQTQAVGSELNIILTAPGFQFDSDNAVSLPLDSDIAQETQTARFRLTALRPGSATITAELYRGDTYETKLETQIQVADIDEATFTPQRITTQPRPVPQPDFILRIQTIWNETNSTCKFQYQLKSFLFRSVFTENNIYTSDSLSSSWIEQVQGLLATTLENISSSLPTEGKSRLISLGQYLFGHFIPTELQSDFRSLIPQNSAFTLLILADQEAWIPWELLYDGQRFFAERFIIGRWLQELNNTRPYEFPVGAVNIAHYANVEQPQLWATLLEAPGAPPPQSLPAGVLHDSTEAMRGLHLIRYSQSSDVANLRNAPVTLDNINDTEDIELQMRPAKLNLRRNRPFVTLSYVKTDTSELTALENTWASAFIRAGCSGFTGSLWAVEPAVEAAFISCFYNRLWAGASLGEAFYTSRQLARAATPDSLDWLAYVLFGDPMARPYRPVPGDGYAIVEPIGREIDDPLSPGASIRFRVKLPKNPPVWHEDRVIDVAENLVFENLQVHIVTYGLQVIPDLPITMTLTAKGDYLGWFTLVVPNEITETSPLVQVYFADGMRQIHNLNFSLKIENGREE